MGAGHSAQRQPHQTDVRTIAQLVEDVFDGTALKDPEVHINMYGPTVIGASAEGWSDRLQLFIGGLEIPAVPFASDSESKDTTRCYVFIIQPGTIPDGEHEVTFVLDASYVVRSSKTTFKSVDRITWSNLW